MEIEKNNMVDIVRKLSQFVTTGELAEEAIPLDDLKGLLEYTFASEEKNNSEALVETFMNLLQVEIKSQDQKKIGMLLTVIAENMEIISNLHEFYKKREQELLINTKIMLLHNNNLYEEIVNYYEENKINEEFLKNHTYNALAVIKEKKGEIGLFQEISKKIFEQDIEIIKRKKKIKITFLLKDSTEWSCKDLYRKFNTDDRFVLNIVVIPFQVGTSRTIYDTYDNTIKYFEENNYNVTGIYDECQRRYKSWKEMGLPDIIFHLNPHYKAFLESGNICNIPLSVLNIYIPYGIMTYGNVEHQFNQLSHHLYWKIFCESLLHKQMAKKYSDIGDTNVIYSGYVKMDSFWKMDEEENLQLWKIQENIKKSDVKKIIYAPHYSIKNGFAGFGNFDKNYLWMYQYAKENQKNTSWIFRPHPMLRSETVTQGLFKSENEYDDYLKLWNDLPNAKVVENGTYDDVFKTSDAMILDSVSFMSEYLYVHKPILFLSRDRQTFNDFGEKLLKVLYTVDGEDTLGIEEFMQNVVFDGNDVMKVQRDEFFEEYLDYKKINGKSASEFIYDNILEEL